MQDESLTNSEWDELLVLKSAITYNPASMATSKMEYFTELLVKTLKDKGDGVVHQAPTNY
jgi:hypothetical protein